jgi:hypothetical protein
MLVAALALPLLGCVDWSDLPRAGQARDAATPDARAANVEDSPIVQWSFAEPLGASIPDEAASPPSLPLRRQSETTGTARVEGGELVLAGAAFVASAADASALVDAIARGDGGGSIELWCELATPVAQRTRFLTIDPLGVTFSQEGSEVRVDAATSAGSANDYVTAGLGAGRHQITATYRAAGATWSVYVDGVNVSTEQVEGNATGARLPPASSMPAIVQLGSAESGWTGRFAAVTVFDRTLDPAVIARRFAAGPP